MACKMQDTNFFSTCFLNMAKPMQVSNILPLHPLSSPFLSLPLLTLSFFHSSMGAAFTSQRLWAASGTRTVKAVHSFQIACTSTGRSSCGRAGIFNIVTSTSWLRERMVNWSWALQTVAKQTSHLLWMWKSHQCAWRWKCVSLRNGTKPYKGACASLK